jgi:trk system potassium uptake protein
VHVVVVGCGRVGSELAGMLEKTGHTVAIVDKRRDAFRRLPTGFSGQTIVGFGFDRDTLVEAGIEGAGALAAVTSGDNSNIMSARVARETFQVERVVARIYDPRRAVIYQRLGIPTVATVSWTTDQVMRRLLPGAHPADWVDGSGQVCLVERDLPPAWAGHKLVMLHEPGRFVLSAVTRLGSARVFDGNIVGQEGDVLHFIVDINDLDALQQRLEGRPDEGPGH